MASFRQLSIEEKRDSLIRTRDLNMILIRRPAKIGANRSETSRSTRFSSFKPKSFLKERKQTVTLKAPKKSLGHWHLAKRTMKSLAWNSDLHGQLMNIIQWTPVSEYHPVNSVAQRLFKGFRKVESQKEPGVQWKNRAVIRRRSPNIRSHWHMRAGGSWVQLPLFVALGCVCLSPRELREPLGKRVLGVSFKVASLCPA